MGHPTKRRHGSDREIQGLELCTWDIPQRGDMDLTKDARTGVVGLHHLPHNQMQGMVEPQRNITQRKKSPRPGVPSVKQAFNVWQT